MIESGLNDDNGLKDEPLILMISSDLHEQKNQSNQENQRIRDILRGLKSPPVSPCRETAR